MALNQQLGKWMCLIEVGEGGPPTFTYVKATRRQVTDHKRTLEQNRLEKALRSQGPSNATTLGEVATVVACGSEGWDKQVAGMELNCVTRDLLTTHHIKVQSTKCRTNSFMALFNGKSQEIRYYRNDLWELNLQEFVTLNVESKSSEPSCLVQ